MLEAILWDVDGTLAETERDGHLVAFNRAFAQLEVPWRWSEQRYAELLHIAGGLERLLYDMQSQLLAPASTDQRRELAEQIHKLKNVLYAAIVTRGNLPLRPGVPELLMDCSNQGFPMAIVTTTSRANVDALLGVHLGSSWRSHFAAVVCGEDAPRKKPDPLAYTLALRALGARPQDTIALEDSGPGITAATAAGIPVIATRSHFFPLAADARTLAQGPGLASVRGWKPQPPPHTKRIGLEQIVRWHSELSTA
jgi:HAD superfamily hydrolase (TIGR01509 family)